MASATPLYLWCILLTVRLQDRKVLTQTGEVLTKRVRRDCLGACHCQRWDCNMITRLKVSTHAREDQLVLFATYKKYAKRLRTTKSMSCPKFM
ncbi:hypothetical protein BDV98DRAFT_577511 [Pterulicium gracile]|uniref:Secreted protein n=1 Tax=Pterulicium gracile TaxID=1884261 RepID=A0A5C3Q5S5_9AGAR|nr:hypothetical protein BDV98DRAFT_577511 [Pterula gracilis]